MAKMTKLIKLILLCVWLAVTLTCQAAVPLSPKPAQSKTIVAAEVQWVGAHNLTIVIIIASTLVVVLLVCMAMFTRTGRRMWRAITALTGVKLPWQIERGGGGATGAPAPTLNEMAENLQQTKDALELTNNTTIDNRVEERTVELTRISDRLRQAQFELVQHEKMSTLGQLAAGVAHEVNTPTGAILNASVDAGVHLKDFLTLSMGAQELSADTRKWLAGMFEALFSEGAARGDIAVRSERRQVEKKLRDNGYTDARRIAEVIVVYDKAQSADDKQFLDHLADNTTLSVLEHVLALKMSSEISQVSAKKIARIVRAL